MYSAPATTLRGSTGTGTWPLDELDLEAGEFKNPRTMTGLAPADIRELALNIWDHGLLDPLTIRRYSVGEPAKVRYLVEDGQRRTLSLRYLAEAGYIVGNIEVPVIRIDDPNVLSPMDIANSLEAFVQALIMAQQRKPLSSYEQVEAAATLLAGFGKEKKKQADIAKILGRSDAWVSRMLTAWKASTPELKLAFGKGEITDEQWKELATVKAAEQPAVVADVAATRAKGERTAARDKSKAEAKKNTPEPKKRPATIAKEQAAAAKNGAAKRDLFADLQKPPAMPPARALESRDVTASEIMAMAKVIAPADQYMKGVLDMARYLAGEITTSKLAKPFRVWLDRVKKKMAGKSAKKKPSTYTSSVADALASEKKASKMAKKKPVAGVDVLPTSKACTARHHHRCKDKATCACVCHKGK